MSKAVQAVKNVFNPKMPDTSGIQAAHQEQAARLDDQERRVSQAADGQRRARRSNRGLLAFIDDQLSSTFGGG